MKENENYQEVIDVNFTEDKGSIVPQGQNIEDRYNNLETDEEKVRDKSELPMEIEKIIEQEEPFQNNSFRDQEEQSRDTSFKTYNQEQVDKTKKKKKSFMARVKKACTKTVGFLIMAPTMLIAIGISAAIIGAGFITGIGLIGAGVIGAVATAFITTAQPGLLGWLGFFLVLGALSSGGFVMCIVMLLMRKVKQLIIMMRTTRRQRYVEKQEA